MKKFFGILFDNFSTLRNRTIRIYISGQGVSLLGTWMQQTAQAWVVWQLAHNATALGTVALVSQVPFFLLGPWAGAWADRLNRRRVLIGTQIISMFLALTLAFLVQTHLIKLWEVYLLALLLGIVSALDLPAQQAFIGDISPKDDIQKTVGLNASLQQLGRTVGPAVAGWAIAAFGLATAFWLNAVSFLAVIFSLLAIQSKQEKKHATGSGFKDFLEGAHYIIHQPMLRLIIIFSAIQTFFGFSIIQILPAVATNVLKGQADVLGILLGSSGAGALSGTLFVIPFMRRIQRTCFVIAGGVAWSGLWYVLLSLSHYVPLAMLCLFMSGVGAAVAFTTSLSLMQTLAPGNMRARLLSTLLMISFGLQPIASLLVGYFADIVGVTTMVFFNGSMMIIATILLLWLEPTLRKLKTIIKPRELAQEYTPPEFIGCGPQE